MQRMGLILLGALALASCGGGGGGDDSGGGSLPLFVDIDYRGSPSVTTAAVNLDGIATCDDCPPSVANFGSCPAINAPQGSSIPVTWQNRTTGATGPAAHGIVGSCSCLFSECFVSYSHRWSATVPLGIGNNAIEVRASSPSAGSGLDSLAITRLPAAAGGLAAVAGKGQVTLNWPPVSGATSYNLYFAKSRDVTTASGTKIAGVTSPFVHSGLQDDATYYYVATTVIDGFEGPASEIAWATPGWRTEGIATTASTTLYRDAAIAADSAGAVHVHHSYDSYSGTAVFMANRYLTNAGGSWAALPVENPSSVSAALALDAADAVQVGYVAFAGATRAALASGAWTVDVADATGSCNSALALDSGGKAHLAYYSSAGAQSIRYATSVSGAWVTGDIEPLVYGGCYGPGTLSLGLDSAGAAHVAFSGEFPGYGLRYATNRSGPWTVVTLDPGNVTRLALAVDGNDKVHVAYTNNVAELKYAGDVTGAWIIEVLDGDGGPNHPALAVENDGKVNLSYVDGDHGGELRYVTGSAGSWRLLNIDTADSDFSGSATDTAVAVDAQGKVHIAYYRDGALRYATNR